VRITWVVVGVVVLVIGVVLQFVPVASQGSETVVGGSDAPYWAGSVSGVSLTGSIPVSVAWSSSTAVTVLAGVASGGCSSPTSVSGVASQSGTSGTFTLNQPDGGCLLLESGPGTGGSSVNVTFTIKTALTTVGSAMIIFGVILVIVGLVLRRKSAKAPAPPNAPSSSTAPPPTG
jgi:uncharacterized membrane protein